MIDFGLSSVSSKLEDKAVDLYVLKRAFISTHPGSELLFDKIIESYKAKVQNGLKIVAKFREVELRGRKRECFG
jgi:TP53 regulating kinase-like protein